MARVVIDEDLCQGHAMCSLEAPDVFEVPKRGTVQLRRDPGEGDLDAVRLAVRHCPTGALTLEED